MTLPAIVAFVLSLATVYGARPQVGMWALILVLLAVPVWVFLLREQTDEPAADKAREDTEKRSAAQHEL